MKFKPLFDKIENQCREVQDICVGLIKQPLDSILYVGYDEFDKFSSDDILVYYLLNLLSSDSDIDEDVNAVRHEGHWFLLPV